MLSRIKKLLTGNQKNSKTSSIGLIAIMKNEALNIEEWVSHYKWQGIDKIFLIDNGSTDNARSLIEKEIYSGFVEYFWRPKRSCQTRHYRRVFNSAGIENKVEWLLMADLDEFWFAKSGNIKDFLAGMSGIDLIYTNWSNFGSSGHVNHPTSLRRDILHRIPGLAQHCNTKWICRTSSMTAKSINVHKVKGINSCRVISENVALQINHYIIQSRKYFEEVKMKRGDAMCEENDELRTLDYFKSIDTAATLIDDQLQKKMELEEASCALVPN
jgi:hypothetical protein